MGDTTESGMAGLKKAAIGALTILVTAGAGWFATTFMGGSESDVAAASPPPIEININNENIQTQSSPTIVVIESIDAVEVESADPAKKKPKW